MLMLRENVLQPISAQRSRSWRLEAADISREVSQSAPCLVVIEWQIATGLPIDVDDGAASDFALEHPTYHSRHVR